MRSSFAATALVAALPLAFAQTSTDCDPTKKSCPSDVGLSSSSYSVDFTQQGSNASWSAAAYTTIDYTSDGAVFSIANKNQAPTIQTDFYFLFGRVDVVMKAAPGTGIVSSIVLESDDLDEIDWEFLGGSADQVQSDFFGKGNTTAYDRVQYHDVADTQGTWHTYSVDWSSERLEWLIDGSVVRTLPYSTALTVNGQNYPQTPMRLKLGNWCGGCSSAEGTVTWAGGATTFGSQPYNMLVKSVSITNANPACSYSYSDMTGSWESITLNTSGCNVENTGSSSSTSGSSSASDSTTSNVSPSGSATGSVSSGATVAPTSSLAVAPISEQTGVVASTTITGSAYSTNSAAISSLNAGNTLVTVTGGSTASSKSTTASSSSSTAASTGGAASTKSVAAAGSLLGLFLAFLL